MADTRQDRIDRAIASELAQQQLMVRNEIRAAIGWLGNVLDSKGQDWVADLTLQEALNGAGEWAHDMWTEYQDEAPTRITQRKVGT